jgi:hypothetical protein
LVKEYFPIDWSTGFLPSLTSPENFAIKSRSAGYPPVGFILLS